MKHTQLLRRLCKKRLALKIIFIFIIIGTLYFFSYSLVLPVIENSIHDEKDIVPPTLVERVVYLFYEPIEILRNYFDDAWNLTETGYINLGGRRSSHERRCFNEKRRDLIYEKEKLIAEVIWIGKHLLKITKWHSNGQKASIQDFSKEQYHNTTCWNESGKILANGKYKHTGFYHPSTININKPLFVDGIGLPFEGTFCEYSFPNKVFILTKRKDGKVIDAKYLSGKTLEKDFINNKLIVKTLDSFQEIGLGSPINLVTNIIGKSDIDIDINDKNNSKKIYKNFFGLSKNLEFIVLDETVVGITAIDINVRAISK